VCHFATGECVDVAEGALYMPAGCAVVAVAVLGRAGNTGGASCAAGSLAVLVSTSSEQSGTAAGALEQNGGGDGDADGAAHYAV
jgi:hypothetical protein